MTDSDFQQPQPSQAAGEAVHRLGSTPRPPLPHFWRHPWKRALSLLFASLLLDACATLSAVQSEAADALLPVQDEVELGKQLKAEVLSKEQVVDDPVVQGYVADVGKRLIAHSPELIPDGMEPSFTVLEGEDVNAFTIPGGHIFIYTGLLRFAESESELAGVMAHELGHVSERHIAKQLVTQLGLQSVGAMVLGKDPSAIAELAASIAANGYLLRYSRGAESEADSVGMEMMIPSGLAPEAMIGFFRKLRKMEGRDPSAVEVFLSSHPPPKDRAEHLQEQLDEAGNPRGQSDPDPIERIQARLPEREGLRSRG